MTIINNYLPAVVAIITDILLVVLTFKKISSYITNNEKENKKLIRTLLSRLAESDQENRELKRLVVQTVAKQNKIKLPEAESEPEKKGKK